MKRAAIGGGGAWALAAAGSVVTVVLFLGLIRTPEVSLARRPSKPAAAAKVELAWKGDALLKEETGLRDPTPLFLPTRWNASEDALALNALGEPGGSFPDYAPLWAFDPAELKLELPAPVEVPLKAADVLAIDKPDRPFGGFGETDSSITPLPSRGGFIEVAAQGSGQVILRQPLPEEKAPVEGTWQPLEFLVTIDSAGIVRPPVLTESSRVAAVDSYFENYLVKTLHIGEQLAPGFYRISIGP